MSAARSVLVDGRPVARIGGTAVSVTPCADGLHSFVLTRVDAQVVELWRFRHEDGAVERLIADMPVQERHRERVVVAQAAPRVFVCGEYGGVIRWYAPGGVAGVVPGGRRGLLCACSPDGERLAIVCEPEHDATRGDRPAPVGRVIEVDTGALILEWTGGAAEAFALLDDGAAVAYVDAAKTSLVVASLVDGSSRAIGLRAPVEPRRVLAGELQLRFMGVQHSGRLDAGPRASDRSGVDAIGQVVHAVRRRRRGGLQRRICRRTGRRGTARR